MLVNYEDQRTAMVLSQLKPNGITHKDLLTIAETLPREEFVNHTSGVYTDCDLPLGGNRHMLSTLAYSLMIKAADLQLTDKVLTIGCMTGYFTSLLGSLSASVVGLDHDPKFLQWASRMVKEQESVFLICGPLTAGYVKRAPYDKIFIEGSVDIIPKTLLSQLAVGGKLIAFQQKTETSSGHLICLTKTSAEKHKRFIIRDWNAPLLTDFKRPESFEL